MKKLIALLLAAMLLLSLAACSGSKSNGNATVPTGGELLPGGVTPVPDGGETPASTGGAVDVGGRPATEQDLIGTWKIDFTLGKEMLEMMIDPMLESMQLGFEPTEAQKAEILNNVPASAVCHITGTITFRSDGTSVSSMDPSMIESLIDWELAIMPPMLRVLLPKMLEKQLADQGIQMTVEEYVAQITNGMTLDGYIDYMVNYMGPMLKSAFQQAGLSEKMQNMESYYELRDGKLYSWTDENPEKRNEQGVTVEMRGGSLWYVQMEGGGSSATIGSMNMDDFMKQVLPLELKPAD